VTVDIRTDRTFDYSANWPVNVVVKGGPAAGNFYSPPSATGTGLHPPVNPNNGQFYGISHITFCWKKDNPPPPDTAQLKIEKTVDHPVVYGGENVVFTISVTNHGPAAAQNTKITDSVPAGLTVTGVTSPCTYVLQLVTCNVGTLAKNETKTYKISAKADPLPPVAGVEDTLDISKVERHISLQPGQSLTQQLTCGPNAIMTDAAVRIDNVDLNTGDYGSVEVRRLKSISPSTYEAYLKNHASGQAQVKLFGVCVGRQTWGGRQITVGPLLTKTLPTDKGTNTLELTCPAGTTPVSPGYELDGTRGVLLESAPVGSDTREFTFKTDTDNASITVSMRCLDNRTSEVGGVSGDLQFEPITRKVTIGPGQVVSESLTCGIGYKGIVAGWEYPDGLVRLGNDPQPITRVFKIWNPTNAPLEATLHLLCLSLKTRAGEPEPREYVNTAYVTSTTTTAPGSILSDSASVTVKPGTPAAPPAPVVLNASFSGGSLVLGAANLNGSATVLVRAANRVRAGVDSIRSGAVIAQGLASAGSKVKVRLKPKAAKAIRNGSLKKVRVSVKTADGSTHRVLRVKR
jgi:uncharacterized repeat protein (TIGR01451 family)